MKKTIALLLTAALLLTLLSGCGASEKQPDSKPVPSPSAAAEETVPAISFLADALPEPDLPERPDGVHADVDYDDMHWELYDMTAFNAWAARLASGQAEAEEAERIIDWLSAEYTRLQTYSELAWIDFYAGNDPDGTVGESCRALDEMLTQASDTLRSAVSSALDSDAGTELTDYLGEEAARDLADYEDMTEREAALWNRETELVLEYNSFIERTDLSLAALNKRAGKVFLELVSVRNELAELQGYDSYADYAYEQIYARDYTPEDAAALCEKIKPYAREYFADCYYSGAFSRDVGTFSAGELMDLLRTFAPRISLKAAQALQYMEDHDLYMLESGRIISQLGYTTTLPLYNAPFLYNALYENYYDVSGVFHEFGHYYDAYINPEPEDWESAGSYDVFEIHSTSMEALLYGWYDEIFGGEADTARIFCLDGLIDNVISGCIYDEFLQKVYSTPDLTVGRVNKLFRDVAASYGKEFYAPGSAYEWMYVSHNFESPFYYISYAVSVLASLQIWALAQRDRQAAIDLYNDLVSRGAYTESYCELVRAVGLKLFTEDLEGCIGDAWEELHRLCLAFEAKEQAA